MEPRDNSGIERWATGLALGQIARVLSDRSAPGMATFRNALRADFVATLENLGAYGSRSEAALRYLPTSTLRLLLHPTLEGQLSAEHYRPDLWRSALKSVSTSQKAGRPPLLSGARLMAHLLLEGHCSTLFLARCGRAMIGDNWRFIEREEDGLECADPFLDQLRAKTSQDYGVSDTFDRIELIEEFEAKLPSGGRQHWPAVQNAVYQQLFAWPLLVDKDPLSSLGAFSIPVAVDVIFDRKSNVYTPGGDDIYDGAPIDAEGWRDELARALTVAKNLWRSKHGGISTLFRDEVMSASVKFNFDLAARIVARSGVGLELSEQSMGPYFSQVILHRLLGRTHGFTAAITGSIGTQRKTARGELTLDYEFGPAEKAAGKLDFVFENQGFSKFVLSTDQQDLEMADAYKKEVSDLTATEVNYCGYMSNVADAVQSSGWRQHVYVRAPDVLRLVHLHPEELLAAESQEVKRVAKLLAENTHPVLSLPADISVLAVASYLNQVNTAEREAKQPAPPSLAWTFFRAVEDENDRRLWHTIWHAFGGSREEFTQFRHATQATEAANLLTAALNTFSPRESCLSHRAPDLLIFMASGRLSPSSWKTDATSYRSHMFPAIIEAINIDTLLPSPNEAMRKFIGRTRIIVMEAGGQEVGLEHRRRSLTTLTAELRGALGRLSTFRFAFTQQMASVLLTELRFQGPNVRTILKGLVDAGYLLSAAGQYWVRGGIGVEGESRLPEGLKADRHWAAAKALMPFLGAAQSPGLEVAHSFHPQNVHEAMYHLEAAGDLAWNATADLNHGDAAWRKWDDLRRTVRVAQSRMLQFLALPSSGIVQQLTRKREGLPINAAWGMAKKLLAEKAQLGIEPAPGELTTYANAGAEWIRQTDDQAVDDEKREGVRRAVMDLYARALIATAPEIATDPAVRLSVLTHYGYWLARGEGSFAEVPATLEAVRAEITTLTDRNVISASATANWFELEGDRLNNSSDAAGQYRLAATMSPKYFSTWVKLAGASVGANEIERLRTEIELAPISLDELFKWASRPEHLARHNLSEPWIANRWQRGVTELERLSRGEIVAA